MNVWIIDHYSSEPKYGGISRQYDFATGLSERGYNVVVVSSAFSHFLHEYITDDGILISEICPKVHYAYLHTSSYETNKSPKRILNMLSFKKAVEKNALSLSQKLGKPDVVIGCSIHPFTWLAAYHVASKFGSRFIAEVRDLWPATQIYNHGMSPHHPVALLWGTIEKKTFDRAERIIYSMSRGDKYICDILGYPREKAIWIDQPMNCERFDKNALRYSELPEEIRSFIGDSFLCVFTGYYMEYEGVYEMLKAAKILKGRNIPVRFVFVGSGKEEQGMRSYVNDNNVDNVYVGGRISKELVPALLGRAQICLAHLAVRGNPNSYKFDASKNKLTEYMYSDSCIIYGTYIENHYVQTSGAGLTIEPYNAAAFADAIEKVYRMPEEERRKYGLNAREHVLINSTLEKLTDKYVSILGK